MSRKKELTQKRKETEKHKRISEEKEDLVILFSCSSSCLYSETLDHPLTPSTQ